MTSKFVNGFRLVVLGGAISYRALFNWTSPPMFLGTLFAYPALQMVFFVYLGREVGTSSDNFYVLGNAVISASAACVFGGTMAIANERRFGTLGAVLLSPRNRVALWLGRALPYALNGLLVMAFTLAVGQMSFDLSLTPRTAALLLPVFVVGTMSCSAFGLTLGALGIRFRDVFLLSNLAATLMLLLTGTNVPHSTLPTWLAAIGDLVPLTHTVAAVRDVVSGATPAQVIAQIGAEALTGVGYVCAAILLMCYFESASRRSATLDVM